MAKISPQVSARNPPARGDFWPRLARRHAAKPIMTRGYETGTNGVLNKAILAETCRKKLPFGLASSRVPPNNRTYRQPRALRNRSGSPTAGYSLVNP